MIILQAKTKQGKSRELIKRFILDKKSATLITDELGLEDIYKIIKDLEEEGYEINNSDIKNIKTMQYANCNADYYGIAEDRYIDSLYLDIHMPKSIISSIKEYRKDLEREYGIKTTLTEQLPADSDVAGVRIVEYQS